MAWRVIKDFPNYEVSDAGLIRRALTGTLLKPQIKKDYLTVNLYRNGCMKTCLVHRIVAEAFLPNPDGLPEVNHKDENRCNPAVSNLEWCNSSYNKLYSCGSKGKKVLMIQDGKVIRRFASLGAASRATGIPTSSLSRCCTSKVYHKTAGGFEWRYVCELD